MNESKKMLTTILNTVQMGQIGIRSGLDRQLNAGLHGAMVSQLKEYDRIETEAKNIAKERDWDLKNVNPAVRKMADMMTRTRLSYGNVNSKLAAMMIQGNTRGIIMGLKDRHQLRCSDGRVLALSQKLLDTEEQNIKQMQGYL